MSDVAAATIHLIRHAAHGHLGHILSGRTPGVSLAEEGRAQAVNLSARLARTPLAAIYASPLERAMETAQALADRQNRAVHADEAFLEIDFGAWTGLRFDDLHSDPRWRVWNAKRSSSGAPGGESMAAVQERAVSRLQALAKQWAGRAIAVVTHSDVIKAVACHCLGLSLDRYDRFDIDPASVSTLVLWEGGGKVVALNAGAA